MFSELIYKQLSWYDRKPRLLERLSNLLKDEISKVNGISTEFIGVVSEAMVALVSGLAISFAFEWSMTLICLVLSPILVLGGVVMAR
jgi:ABC-type multidrug transport system fused ATPase/permease subunit